MWISQLMTSGLEDMGKENASTAGRKETASEKEADKNLLQTVIPEEGSAAATFGNCGVISVLFETPRGFAIFDYDAVKLTEPDAWKHIWADFVNGPKAIVWLRDFKNFEKEGCAINNTTLSPELRLMIQKYVVNGQTLAVGNENYKNVIEDCLGIRCFYSPIVKELMWGLKIQMRHFVPKEILKLTNEDRFQMSKGMEFLLKHHKFEVNLDMMVTRRIIEMAGVVYECDRCVDKHDISLRLAAKHLMEISEIDTKDWDLLKLVTALKIICYPEDKIVAARQLFPEELLNKLMKDAPLYKDKIFKIPCLELYKEIYSACKIRLDAARVLVRLVKQAKKAYEDELTEKKEDEQAGKAASDHEIGPDRKKICRGFDPVMIGELTEWHTMLSAKRMERQVPPTLAPVDALERYTQIPLNIRNIPGILSMDIHPSKDTVATGGIDSNAVLFDWPSCQIMWTLFGHLKKITSLKFVNRNGLFITGSADKTVRIWQEGEDENYSCIHTLKDHTAEVEALTVHASQKYFVSASRDNSWRFYDISTGSCLAQIGESSSQEGYTSAAFHPDGLMLGTGTTEGFFRIWDVKTQSVATNFNLHAGPITAISFSENGHWVATGAPDGVRIFDLRMHRAISSFNSSSCCTTVEFDSSGSYLAVGGSDIRVYEVVHVVDNWEAIKTFPDPGTVTSLKFGADARYIAVGSMDRNLCIFGPKPHRLR